MNEKIKECIDKLLEDTNELSKYVTEPDEFVAVEDIRQAINKVELKIHEARKVFERTKEVE